MSSQVISVNAISVTGTAVSGQTDRVVTTPTTPIVIKFSNVPNLSGTLEFYSYTGTGLGAYVLINGLSTLAAANGWTSRTMTMPTDQTFTVAQEDSARSTTIRNTENQMRVPTYTYTQYVPDINSFSRSGSSIDSNIVFNWSSADSNAWVLQAIRNGVVIATKSGTTETTTTFTPGQINQTGAFIFRLTLTNTQFGTVAVKEIDGTLTRVEPSIGTLTPSDSNQNRDNVINVSWSSSNQQSYTLTIDGNTYTGTTATSLVIPANTLSKGVKSMTLTIKYTAAWGDVRTVSKTVTFTAYGKPAAPTLDGTTIYHTTYPTFVWTSSEQVAYQIIIKNSLDLTILDTGTITSTAKQYTSTVGLQNNATYTLQLRVRNSFDLWSDYSTKTITRIEPSIVALEPNGVNQNKDLPITISWVSTNQQTFSLVVDGVTYNGTTETNITLPAGTFPILKTVSMNLTIRYNSSMSTVLSATKDASFLLVGTPRTPQLEEKTTYHIAQPTFYWTSQDDYTQYHVIVVNNATTVFDSGEVVSTDNFCLCTTTLDNNSTYTVKVAVRTQYGYWSAFDSNTFQTSFEVSNQPSIQVVNVDNGVLINSNTTYSANFSSCEVYRRTENSEWSRIAYNFSNVFSYVDRYVGNETYYYRVTSVSTTGGRNDSQVASTMVKINNFNFVNVENINNGVEFIGDPAVTIGQNRQITTTLYSGVAAPVVETGTQIYRVGTASFTIRRPLYTKFLQVVRSSKVLLYRDRRGEKFYCNITSNINLQYRGGDVYNISFSFTEVPFLESDMYNGDGTPVNVVFWDGTYMFDNTISFSGEV